MHILEVQELLSILIPEAGVRVDALRLLVAATVVLEALVDVLKLQQRWKLLDLEKSNSI